MGDCSTFSYSRLVAVTTKAELQSALLNAVAGDLILLEDGMYEGQFLSEGKSGTSTSNIFLCGTPYAVLSVGSLEGSALEIHNAEYWYLYGFTLTNAKKALQFESVSYSTIDSLQVHHIGEEAIHVKINSTNNVIQNCNITVTGLTVNRAGYGEGVYIGTAVGNGHFDFSNSNTIRNNIIGPYVSAEGIDVKEYTTGTLIENNVFNGTGLSGENSALTLVALKGNYAIVRNNTFYNSIQYGSRTSVTAATIGSWGNYNTYENNTFVVPGCTYGIYIHNPSTTGTGNVVKCNNVVVSPVPRSNKACVV